MVTNGNGNGWDYHCSYVHMFMCSYVNTGNGKTRNGIGKTGNVNGNGNHWNWCC